MSPENEITRRPLKSRNTKWAAGIAGLLVRSSVHPNTISVAGTFFAGLAGICLWLTGRFPHDGRQSALFIAAVCGMQLRLLCNLFDGMVAIEGGRKTPAGEIFNELPDRFSDAFIFIGAAYSMPELPGMIALGWTAAILSVITAYVRALGASMGTGQHFLGPMAKQQRMAAMTFAGLLAALSPWWVQLANAIPLAAGLVSLGCLVTVFRRCHAISNAMKAKS